MIITVCERCKNTQVEGVVCKHCDNAFCYDCLDVNPEDIRICNECEGFLCDECYQGMVSCDIAK